jgi:hypothetical protein
MGIKYGALSPEPIHILAGSGLGIYRSKLKSYDGVSNAIIGGTHESFAYYASIAGGAMPLISHFTQELQHFREGNMPRIALNPLTTEEMQFAKMSNMLMDKVEGREELMGEDGTFKECGANQTEDRSSNFAFNGNELDMATSNGVNDNKLILDVSASEGKDLPEQADRGAHSLQAGDELRKLEDLEDMQNPMVSIVTARDSRDNMENPEVHTDCGEEVPECTKNKIDEAKSDDNQRIIKDCYEYDSFRRMCLWKQERGLCPDWDRIGYQNIHTFLESATCHLHKSNMADCDTIKVNNKIPIPEVFTAKSEDSPEESTGGEENIGRSTLCSLEPDVGTVPPLYYTTKMGRGYANDVKRLEISVNSNCINFSYTSLGMEADSTEQLSLTQEYKDLATLPLMGKGEDTIDVSMDSVYNRDEKQAMSATAQVSEDQSVASKDRQTSQDAIALMDADSSEQQSTKQKAATSKWAAAKAKMMEVMAWIRNRSSKVNAECTEKQSVTLYSKKKNQSVANTDNQTIQDECLYPVAMGEGFTEYSSIKETGQNKKICSRLTQKQDEEKFPKPGTEPSPVLACVSSDDYLADCDRKSELVLDIDPR